MKRYLFLLLFVLTFVVLLSVESSPSATVGYFKKSIAINSWEAFSLPFNDTDMSIATKIGDQLDDQDMIIDITSNFGTTYYDGYGWYGDLDTIVPGGTYWIVRYEFNPNTDYFLMGTVNPDSVTVYIAANSWTSFALNEAQNIAITSLPITGVVDQDMIIDVSTNFGTTYYDGYGWYGDLEYIEPTHVYWYVTTSPTDFSWTYVPGARRTFVRPSPSKSLNKK